MARTVYSIAQLKSRTPAEWLVVHENQIVFRSNKSAEAVGYIQERNLPSNTLFTSSNIVAMTREVTTGK